MYGYLVSGEGFWDCPVELPIMYDISGVQMMVCFEEVPCHVLARLFVLSREGLSYMINDNVRFLCSLASELCVYSVSCIHYTLVLNVEIKSIYLWG